MVDLIDVKHPSWLTELLKQLLAYSGVLASVSYLFGRAYYQGYFDTLGIDISFIHLSWIEYLESGWIYLWATGVLWVIVFEYGLFGLIIFTFVAPLFDEWASKHKRLLGAFLLLTFIVVVIYTNRLAVLKFLQARSPLQWVLFLVLIGLVLRFKKSITKLLSSWYEILRSNPKYFDRIDKYALVSDRLLLQIIILLIFIVTVYFVSLGADNFGKFSGTLYLNQKAKNVELVSSIPIISNAVKNLDNVYVQDDLRFLFFNDGHYFLSKLDGKCKLQEVFVMDQSNVESIKLTQLLPTQICSKP